jgi:anti-sigma factor RsiW
VSAHVRERLSAYLDGELDPAERAAIGTHLAACRECSAFLEELALVDSAMAGLPLPETKGDEEFAARVRARIETEDARVLRARGRGRLALRALPAWTWAAAAALLLAVVTPLTLRGPRAPGERVAVEAVAPAAAPTASREGPTVALSRVAPATVPAVSGGEAQAPQLPARLEEKALRAPAASLPVRVPPAAKPAGEAERLAKRDQALGFLGDESVAPEPPRPAAAPRAEPARAAASLRSDAPSAVSGGVEDRLADGSRQAVARDREKAEAATRAPAPVPPQPTLAAGSQAVAVLVENGVAQGVAGGVANTTTALGTAPQETSIDRETAAKKDRASGDERTSELAAFGRLEAQRPQTAQEWRQLREAWRALVRAHPEGPRADEARVRAIEAATRAYRASAEDEDRRVLRRDIAEYLARKDAPEANRMRMLLRETER